MSYLIILNRIIADLIAEGATAGHGFAYDAYASQGIQIQILLDRYFDPINDYNHAESYYMSDLFLSNQTIIIGDPKASIIIDNTASVVPNPELYFAVYPNPGFFHVKGEGLQSIEVIDVMGRIVYKENPLSTTYHLIAP